MFCLTLGRVPARSNNSLRLSAGFVGLGKRHRLEIGTASPTIDFRTGAPAELLAETKPDFHDVPIGAGHRDCVGRQARIGGDEGRLDGIGIGLTIADEFLGRRDADSLEGFPRRVEISALVEARAGAVLAPLVPDQSDGRHDVEILPGKLRRHEAISLVERAEFRPAAFVLRPEPVYDEFARRLGLALLAVGVRSLDSAIARRPRQSEDVEVKRRVRTLRRRLAAACKQAGQKNRKSETAADQRSTRQWPP